MHWVKITVTLNRVSEVNRIFPLASFVLRLDYTVLVGS